MSTKDKMRVATAPIVWPRADPVALLAFDATSKHCTMNCGPHIADPRSATERKFLCGECIDYALAAKGQS